MNTDNFSNNEFQLKKKVDIYINTLVFNKFVLYIYILTCTTAFLAEVSIWALGEALPIQQYMGGQAGGAVLRALPCTPQTGWVASWKKEKAAETIRKVAIPQGPQLRLSR